MAAQLIAGCVKPPNTFYHSGDLGDVIYSLPAVKALNGGLFCLGPECHPLMAPREQMTWERFNTIAPLLRVQEYIYGCEYRIKLTGVTINLNNFRDLMTRGQQLDMVPGFNLAKVVLKRFNLPLTLDNEPWLTVDCPRVEYPVIIARSARYQNDAFNWKGVLEQYRGRVGFIGTKDEHALFEWQIGRVPYIPTEDLLEAARLIAGSKLFIGNQSCPFSIAVGLGHDAILEECPSTSNTLFERKNIMVGSAIFPRIASSKLSYSAPGENHTGFGQLSCAILDNLIKMGIDCDFYPWCWYENEPMSKAIVHSRIPGNHEAFADWGKTGLVIATVDRIIGGLHHGQALLTMWESSRIEKPVIDAINARAKVLIVPTTWNATVFSACGVNVPIRVVPLGTAECYSYKPFPKADVFRFGAAGKLHFTAGFRKGIPETIECFTKAFPTETDVELNVKVFDTCKLDEPQDPRVKIIRRFIPTPEMVKWYEDLNCFVSLTKGEGWGLHLHQSMATGRPVIAPVVTGQADFINPLNSFACSFRLEHPDHGLYKDRGVWCEPDKEDAIRLMRFAYNNRDITEERGKVACESVKHLTWKNTTRCLVRVLEEFNFL